MVGLRFSGTLHFAGSAILPQILFTKSVTLLSKLIEVLEVGSL